MPIPGLRDEGVPPAGGATAAGRAARALQRREVDDLALLAFAAGIAVLLSFLAWETVEQLFVHSDEAAHRVHYARGISTSLFAAGLVAGISWRQRRRRTAALEAVVAERTREVESARSFLSTVVDSTPAGLVVLDEQFRIVRANPVAEKVHDATLPGRACFDVFAGRGDRCPECPAVESLVHGRSVEALGVHTDSKTGEVLALECHPLVLPDGRRHVLLVERVITEQKKLQARLLHQEKMAAFGLLAASIAHDMGNPIASMEAQLQILDDERMPSDCAEVVGTVRTEAARLRRILRELVDFARRRRDEASLVSIQSVVEDALRLIRHDRRMRKVALTVDFDRDAPAVWLVEDHLMQVVLNLLMNALDAMPDGGTLRVEVRALGASVALRVHDDGEGMDRAVLARCFEPLFTTKAPGKGTGLGLSICRDIIEGAGGKIELHSSRGRGTTAVVMFPGAKETS